MALQRTQFEQQLEAFQAQVGGTWGPLGWRMHAARGNADRNGAVCRAAANHLVCGATCIPECQRENCCGANLPV
jgi:hypothetical protein